MGLIALIKNKFSDNAAEITAWDTVLKWMMLVLVFILPFFFLPGNAYPVEFSKTIVFNCLMVIATVLFLLKIIVRREAVITSTYLLWPIIGLAIINLVSFVLSRNHYISAWGVSGYYSAGVISVVCFVLFFFLLLQIIRNFQDVKRFLFVFLLSAALVIIYSFFQVLGLHLLPWSVTHDVNFNAVAASAEGLAIFAAAVLLLGAGAVFYGLKKWEKIAGGVLALLAFALLILLDQKMAYYILAVCFFLFLLIVSWRSKYFSNAWVVGPTVALTVVVIMVFFNMASITGVDIKSSAVLDHGTSAAVAWQSFLHAPLWGSGPQTFTVDFEKYRTVNFNNSALWNLRFIKGSNEWFTQLAQLGLGGVLAMLILSVWFMARSLRRLVKIRKPDWVWKLGVIFVVSWASLLLTSLVAPFNFILTFTWWFLLVLAVKVIPDSTRQSRTLVLGNSPKTSMLSGLVFVGVSVLAVLLVFFSLRTWLADYNFSRAQTGVANKIEITKVQSYLNMAIKFNPREPVYYLSLAQSYATQAQLEALKSQPDITLAQQLTQKVLDNLKTAQDLDSRNPIIYEQIAAVYDSLRSVIGNADELAVGAYRQAVVFEPGSALAYLNLGRAEVLWAQAQISQLAADGDRTGIDQLLNQAISDLAKARSLKKDIVLAEYTQAVALDLLGRVDDALEIMNSLAARYPEDTQILSALASLTQEKGDLDKADELYQRVIKLSPDDSNAHWQLALVYEKQAKIDQALSELDIVQKANPDNETVKEKIESLKTKPESGQ
jgi:tetratricopeptide (TPR) repeat protein